MIVSNTTPISNLLHLDNISLLAKLFGVAYIPEAFDHTPPLICV